MQKRILITVLAVAGLMAGGWFAHVAAFNHAIDSRPKLSAVEAGASTCGVVTSQMDEGGPVGSSWMLHTSDGRTVIVRPSAPGGFIVGEPGDCRTQCQILSPELQATLDVHCSR